eukprot:8693986-Pyramimonas_sp.AAC.1
MDSNLEACQQPSGWQTFICKRRLVWSYQRKVYTMDVMCLPIPLMGHPNASTVYDALHRHPSMQTILRLIEKMKSMSNFFGRLRVPDAARTNVKFLGYEASEIYPHDPCDT